MSKSKPPKKKVVVTTQSRKTAPSTRRTRKSASAPPKTPAQSLILGRQNYLLMGAGALLILIGLLLMTGGEMPSPDVWDENIIYSFRRTTLAPILILAGLAVEVYAIFKK